ncbi:MAG: hypothetical protein JSR46_04010, partial [Verrucomicrobia bacterium]|nr:hypothetical protein [Verrucomicrobiota bacterium]
MNVSTIIPVDRRYYFALQDDIVSLTPINFGLKIDEIQSQLDSVEKKQREIAGKLYSYSVPLMRVYETHQTWREELRGVSTKLYECAFALDTLHQALPFQDSLNLIIVCLQKIHHLELKLESVQVIVDQLDLLLNSQIYADAVCLYKQTIGRCEEIIRNHKDQVAQNREIEEIFKKVSEQDQKLEGLPDLLTRQVRRVHRDLRRFYKHACENSFEAQKIGEVLNSRLKEIELPHCGKNSFWLQVESIISDKQLEGIVLREDLLLRSGWWGLEDFLTKQCNSAITPCLNRLEEVAKLLQMLQVGLQTSLYERYQGVPEIHCSPKTYREMVDTAEKLVKKICQVLYTFMFTGEVSIGLYYASRLFAYIKELRFISEHFSINKNAIQAFQSTFRLVSLLNDKKSSKIENIEILFWSAYRVAAALNDPSLTASRFNSRMVSCLQTLIARIGRCMLKKTERDRSSWLQIVKGVYVNRDGEGEKEQADRLILYVEKEVTDWFYFSQKSSNLSLALAIHALETDFLTNPSASKLLENADAFGSFKQIYQMYLKSYSPPEIVEQLCLLFRAHQTDTSDSDLLFLTESQSHSFDTIELIREQVLPQDSEEVND